MSSVTGKLKVSNLCLSDTDDVSLIGTYYYSSKQFTGNFAEIKNNDSVTIGTYFQDIIKLYKESTDFNNKGSIVNHAECSPVNIMWNDVLYKNPNAQGRVTTQDNITIYHTQNRTSLAALGAYESDTGYYKSDNPARYLCTNNQFKISISILNTNEKVRKVEVTAICQ